MVSRSGSPIRARSPAKRAASPRKASPKRAASPRKASPKKRSPAKRPASPRKASPRKASPRKASPRKASPKRKKKTTKKAAAHPMYKDMIASAIKALKQRGGSSRQAISKYIAGHYRVGDNSNVHLRMAIKRALASGMLIQSTNHSGTFRLSEAARRPAKPKRESESEKACS